MSEEETRKARKVKRTSQSKRFIAPEGVPVGLAWIGAPPKVKRDQAQAAKNVQSAQSRQTPVPSPSPVEAQASQTQAGSASAQRNSNVPSPAPQILNLLQGQIQQQMPAPQPQAQMPGQQTPAPKPQAQMPGQQTPAPKPQAQMPLQQTPAPKPQAQMPVQQTPAPQPQVQKPVQQTPAPKPQTQMPLQQTPAPQPQTQMPLQQTPAPQPQAQMPVQQTPAPKPQTQMPLQQTPAPKPQAQMPVQQTPAPRPQAQMPLQQTPTPQTLVQAQSQPQIPLSEATFLDSPLKKKRRVTRNWYWPEEDDSEQREGKLNENSPSKPPTPSSSAQPIRQNLSEPLGLIKTSKDLASEGNRSSFVQALDDFELNPLKQNPESDKFSRVTSELAKREIKVAADARTFLDKLARSLSANVTSRELLELSPRLSPLLLADPELLEAIIALCRAEERRQLSSESVSKAFEQLNRLFDAQILPSRRELAVSHFLQALAYAMNLPEEILLSQQALTEHILLTKYPDKAAEFLLSVLTSSRLNVDELGIRAFKFDRDRSKTLVRIFREALEADPGLKAANKARKERRSLPDCTNNYFSFLLETVSVNAALQDKEPQKRFWRKKGKPCLLLVEEREVKQGVRKVQAISETEFEGLSYEDKSWILKQFAGQKMRGVLPDRLRY